MTRTSSSRDVLILHLAIPMVVRRRINLPVKELEEEGKKFLQVVTKPNLVRPKLM